MTEVYTNYRDRIEASVKRYRDVAAKKEAIKAYIVKSQVSAEECVINAARKHSIVLFGENHDNATGRKFISGLFKRLKEEGIKYLCIEEETDYQAYFDANFNGTAPKDPSLRAPALMRIQYDFSEYFPEMIKEASKAGLEIICIDKPDRLNQKKEVKTKSGLSIEQYVNPRERDKYMFEQIKTRILDVDPKAKILVVVGSVHALESETDSYEEKKPLGAFLSEYAGDDCCSIITKKPSQVNELIPIEGAPNLIGFSTDDSDVSGLIFSSDLPFPSSFYGLRASKDIYYGKHMDWIITIDYSSEFEKEMQDLKLKMMQHYKQGADTTDKTNF